jgi:hypothetical protein
MIKERSDLKIPAKHSADGEVAYQNAFLLGLIQRFFA